MTTIYAILLPGDEGHWAAVIPQERARAHPEHFSQALVASEGAP